ncbi:hypothetical protein RhiirC2_785270 [Rhizophagus irregularis]|uniref:Uncharacterized protein n=1 Tax=Rhizophagus irregularis TaxID=588596 RepID=A0A2N1MWM7_9GLOM|nr:hypothetical protein RhiirC2_785270 [Rhizophagus irregularis]
MTSKAFKAYHHILRRRQLFYLSQLYKAIQQSTVISDSNNRLLNNFITLPTIDFSFYELEPCLSSPSTTKNCIVTLDEFSSLIFGKQLLVQVSDDTCFIVHWVSLNCESLPGDLIKLAPCFCCAAHIPLLPSKKWNADLTLCTPIVSLHHSLTLPTFNEWIRCNTFKVTSPLTWADIEDSVRLYYSRLDFAPNFSPEKTIEAPVIPTTVESSAAAIFANSPLVPFADSCYIFSLMGLLLI